MISDFATMMQQLKMGKHADL
jgi:hypothetical protein